MSVIEKILEDADRILWGPWMLVFLLGTGIYLMIRMEFLPVRNLGYALRCALGTGKKQRKKKSGYGEGEISPFSVLMTELAATVGTGNIVGVATALVLGGPGSLVWMVLASFVGLSLKLTESMLSVKYRVFNEHGEACGGPMYVLQNAFPKRKTGRILASCFALFTVLASFGMGNMVQANSAAISMEAAFGIKRHVCGLLLSAVTLLVVFGGIRTVGKVTVWLVPFMALLYLIGAVTVILMHSENILPGIAKIFSMAFCTDAFAGGVCGSLQVSVANAVRYGVSRGVFSNEAGLGASGITSAAARTGDPVNQGYISMSGVFLDTAVICTVTGLCIVCSGVLGRTDAGGEYLTGISLTIAAFETVFGGYGRYFVSAAVTLFAVATVFAWSYQGEKAFEFLTGKKRSCMIYRFLYSFICFPGAVCSLGMIWNLSDICNALMAVPNLLCLFVLAEEAAEEIKRAGKM